MFNINFFISRQEALPKLRKGRRIKSGSVVCECVFRLSETMSLWKTLNPKVCV